MVFIKNMFLKERKEKYQFKLNHTKHTKYILCRKRSSLVDIAQRSDKVLDSQPKGCKFNYRCPQTKVLKLGLYQVRKFITR